jgi:hypothetical protein
MSAKIIKHEMRILAFLFDCFADRSYIKARNADFTEGLGDG